MNQSVFCCVILASLIGCAFAAFSGERHLVMARTERRLPKHYVPAERAAAPHELMHIYLALPQQNVDALKVRTAAQVQIRLFVCFFHLHEGC